MAKYTADNIEITIVDGTAVIATDYGTSGSSGFTAAHAQIAKIAWGNVDSTYRASEEYPLPVKIYGVTGSTFTISGTISGTGDFYVRTNPTIPLIVKGSTFSTDAPVGISGAVQGVSGGVAVGVTGSVSVLNNVAVFGVSGATAIGITGGRRLNSATDSVTVYGNVGISGGFQLLAADDSVSVYGPGGSTWIHTNIYSGNTAIGLSGDALKVAVTNTGFTFSVSLSSTVGITNDTSTSAIRIQGYTGATGGYPVTIKGSMAGGAVEVAANTALPVGVTGTVEINDTDLLDKIETLKTNINTVATNAAYVLDILNLMNTSGNGAKVIVNSITKPSRIINGQKSLTSTPVNISTDTLKTGITLKSPITNTVDIFIGNTVSVSATTGYILSPGESIFLEVSTLASIFVRTATATATLAYIGS
jgi:hypothetical protein